MGAGVKYSCLTINGCDYSIEEIFPDIYHLDWETHYVKMSDPVKSLSIPVKLIKTHHAVDCCSTKTIFLFREPLSCLTSAALYLNRSEIEDNPISINETVQYLTDFYSSMLIHYIEQSKKNPQNILFVNHGKLVDQGIFEIERIANFLELNIPLIRLEKILQYFPFQSTYEKEVEIYETATVVDKITKIRENEYLKAFQLSELS